MKDIFLCVKKFFCDWIMDYYKDFNQGLGKPISVGKSIDWKQSIADVLKEGDGFLNYNYTMILVNVYGIDAERIHVYSVDCLQTTMEYSHICIINVYNIFADSEVSIALME